MSNKEYNDGVSSGLLIALSYLRHQHSSMMAVSIVEDSGGIEQLRTRANETKNEVDLATISWLEEFFE